MGKGIASLVFLFMFGFSPTVYAASLSVIPETVVAGDPILITVSGEKDSSAIRTIAFASTSLPIFLYRGEPTALVGVDFNARSGAYQVIVNYFDGRRLTAPVIVSGRMKITEPLGIPQKLGGNTAQSQERLVSTLATENQDLARLKTGTKTFWKVSFQMPLASTTVTDPYGYSRLTGSYTIVHKGTDFRAAVGTPVYAMNRGVVRAAKSYQIYGKTVVVDHGLGLQTLYMHLSRIKVNVGELVRPGQLIGLSGETGYAERPHLHVSVRIGGISVNPIAFLSLFR